MDAGTIDTRCGLDCAAQLKLGLIAGTCFEYSDTMAMQSTPVISAEVLPVTALEGGINVMQLKYTSGGVPRMKDSFAIVDGTLKLLRREFGTGNSSVSYKDSSNALEGVTWMRANSMASENYSSTTSADVVAGTRRTDATTYRSTLAAAAASELIVPLATFDGGIKLLFSETPDHGSDSRRVFVPEVGFVLFSSALSPTGGTSQEYRLQKVKNVDGGSACGF
jgi:hypothetical protein